MALIKSITRNYKNGKFKEQQVEVRAEFYKVDDNFVQIQTYSSDSSKTKSRSQTIRLTKEVAMDLVVLINNAFEDS